MGGNEEIGLDAPARASDRIYPSKLKFSKWPRSPSYRKRRFRTRSACSRGGELPRAAWRGRGGKHPDFANGVPSCRLVATSTLCSKQFRRSGGELLRWNVEKLARLCRGLTLGLSAVDRVWLVCFGAGGSARWAGILTCRRGNGVIRRNVHLTGWRILVDMGVSRTALIILCHSSIDYWLTPRLSRRSLGGKASPQFAPSPSANGHSRLQSFSPCYTAYSPLQASYSSSPPAYLAICTSGFGM